MTLANKLPVVLSPEDVTRMIEAAPNLMHRTILMVLYATGIRRTEASLLKVTEVGQRAFQRGLSKWLMLILLRFVVPRVLYISGMGTSSSRRYPLI